MAIGYVDPDIGNLGETLNLIIDGINAGDGSKPYVLAASGALPQHVSASYVITKAGIAALTLGAPTAGTDDGNTLSVRSGTAYAHTITATGLLQTGSANVNVATFAAYAGAGVTLRAYQGKWMVISQVGITFS